MKLHENERRLSLAVRGSQDGLWDWDVTTNQFYFSLRFKELLGFSPNDESLKQFDDFVSMIHTDDRTRTLNLINKNITSGKLFEVEFRLKVKSGEYRWFLARGDTFRDDDGRPLNMAGSISDITKRIDAEQTVQKQMRYLNILDRIGSLCLKMDLDDMLGSVLEELLEIYQCDRAWVIYPCNPDAPFWGVPMERARPEWPGAKIEGITIPIAEDAAETFRLALEKDVAIRYDPESGRELPYEVKNYSVQSQMIKVVHVKFGDPWLLGIHHCAKPHVFSQEEEQIFNGIAQRVLDTLSSLLAASALRKSEESLADAQRLAMVGSWELDLVSNNMTWTDEVYRIFGLDKNEFSATYERFINVLHPEDRSLVCKAYSESIDNKKPYDLVHRLLLNDGTIKYVRAICETFYNSNGKPLRSLGTTQDITERIKSEQLLAESMSELEEKELAKSRFLAAAGHDLRQPLAAANLFIGALNNSEPTPKQKEIIQYLDQSMANFKELLDALLNISKLDEGLITPEITSISVLKLFDWIEMSFSPVAREKQLKLRLFYPKNKMYFIQSDIKLLKIVMSNLISNAIKFTEKIGILISARLRGDKLLLQIRDCGIGISEEYLNRIFDDFFQVKNPQRDKTKGIGLGLSIVKRTLPLIGGAIACRSKVGSGSGSIFELSLPIANLESNLPQLDDVAIANEENNTTAFIVNKNIAVVEDDQMIAAAFENSLQAIGADVHCFKTTEEANNYANINNFDYYIVDYMLDGNITGIQFLDQLRQKQGKPLRAVLLTGDTSPAFISAVQNSNWTVLYKPVNLSQILAQLSVQDT